MTGLAGISTGALLSLSIVTALLALLLGLVIFAATED